MGEKSNDEGVLIRVARWLEKESGQISPILGSVLAAIGPSWFFSNPTIELWPIAGQILVTLLGMVAMYWGKEAHSSSREELRRAKADRESSESARLEAEARLTECKKRQARGSDLYRDLWRGQLALLFNKAKLTSRDRISVYRHTSGSEPGVPGEFQLLSRYSTNPELQKSGRAQYPDNEGCLALAWQSKRYFVGDLPDPEREPEAYVDRQKALGVCRDVATAMKMKSRTYAGFRLEGIDHGDLPIGVVLFESLQPAEDSTELDRVFRRTEASILRRLVDFTEAFGVDIETFDKLGYSKD